MQLATLLKLLGAVIIVTLLWGAVETARIAHNHTLELQMQLAELQSTGSIDFIR